MTDQTDETARRIVQQDVYYCVSSLIHSLLQESGNASHDSALFGRGGAIDPDELMQLAYMEPDADDFRDACETVGGRAIVDVRAAPDGYGFDWVWTDDSGDDGGSGFETELEAWRDAFEATAQDIPDGREVFEHWLVSDWLADKLAERGHSVCKDVAGLTVWGRPTTGQAIYMDGVIQDIARELDGPEAAQGEA